MIRVNLSRTGIAFLVTLGVIWSPITAIPPLCLLICAEAKAQPTDEMQDPLKLRSQVDTGAVALEEQGAKDPGPSFRLEPAEAPEESSPGVEDSSEKNTTGWVFEIEPYLWMAGVKGDTAVGRFEVSGEAGFVDLAKKLDLGVMLHLEGRKERWGFLLDGLYLNVSDEASVRVANLKIRGIDIDGALEMAILEAGAFYRFGKAGTSFDVLGGVRYFSIDVQVDAGPLPTISRGASWVDPFVGGRFRIDLSEKWSFSLRGDIGGFDVGSELTWNVTALLGYRLSKRTTLAFGYRHLDIDYEGSRFSLDAQLSGPYLGMSFRF